MGTPSFSRIFLRPAWSENQATEVLAFVLDLDPDFARSLVLKATRELPASDWACDVVTQHRIEEGSLEHVDLAVQAPDWEVWIEAKINAQEHGGQLESYAEALAKREATHRHLVYLTKPGQEEPILRLAERLSDLDVRLHPLNWKQVGELTRGEAPTQIRRHLATFLRASSLFVPSLNADHITALKRFREASAAFEELFWKVHAAVLERGKSEPSWSESPWSSPARVEIKKGETPLTWAAYTTPALSFIADGTAFLEWDLRAMDDDDPDSELAVSVGLTLDKGKGSWDDDWDLNGSAVETFDQRFNDGWPQIYKSAKLTDFIRSDVDATASDIADWIAGVFRQLIANPPARVNQSGR